MLEIVLTVAPVFVLVGIGYLAVWSGYVSVDIAAPLNTFAIKLAVPLLLFTAMIRLDFAQAFSIRGLVSFYAGALACFAIGIVLAKYVFKRTPGESVSFGFAATFSNSLLLGIPIVERAHGADSLMVAFGVIALHAPLLYTVGMITMEMMRRDGRTLAQSLKAAGRSIIANPLMAGILAGILLNLSGLHLPDPILAPLKMLAGAAIPVALVGLGAALTKYKMTAELPQVLTVAALSLIIHPMITVFLSHVVFGMPRAAVLALGTISAMPPGVNIYVFATMYRRAEGLAASALLISTAFGVITVSAWLYLFEHLF